MKTVDYSKANLIKTAFGCPALAIAGLACIAWTGPFVSAILLIGAAALLASGVQGARKLWGDPTALRYDGDRLTIITMWSQTAVPWTQVHEIGTSTLSTYGFYGLIRIARTNYLTIKVGGGMFGKKYRLLSDMFDLDKAGFAALLDDLVACQRAALGAPLRSQPAAASKPVWVGDAPQVDVFDPDAALAKYLSRRDTQGQEKADAETAPMPMPAFGRRRDMLEGAPREPLTGVRASTGFGRKGI